MTCKDVQAELYEYLDKELDPARHSAIEAHVSTCERCQTELGLVHSLDDRLREVLQSEPIPDALWERVRPSSLEAKSSITSRFRRWSAAAVVALAVGVVAMVGLMNKSEVPFERLMAVPVDELRTFIASRRAMDLATPDPATLRRWFTDKLGAEPRRPPTAHITRLPLVGGRLCFFFERRVPAYMYEIDGHVVSVYAIPAHGIELDGRYEPELARAVGLVNRAGFNHVAWQQDGVIYSVVSNLERNDLLELLAEAS